ncbi:MAG: pyruvate kinase [Clostridia bacterium]|nr:pyruvate kinase [Clostridia bacterium]
MKTKIVATIGPASDSPAILRKMIYAGVDVFRLNFSHGTHDTFRRIIADIHQLNQKLGTHVAILADLQGPKIRIGETGDGGRIFKKGELLIFTVKAENVSPEKILINYANFPNDVRPGETILLDDGKIAMRVEATMPDKGEVVAKALASGVLYSRKGVNLPDTDVSLPSLSEKDKDDLTFILDQQVDWIALSFVRKAADIEELIALMKSYRDKPLLPVIAKIEKPEAVKEIDAIIRVAQGIMVARGDLGVEVPLESVPVIQKRIVQKCIAGAKPVIIATQMMEGMINNPRPTRAEVNDVANSVIDGADALMLSGETSVGIFPVETVTTMKKIIREVELFEDIYDKQHQPEVKKNPHFISDAVIYSGCNLARETNAKAIVSVASTGYSTAKISSYRPKATIFAFADKARTLQRLNLLWGVHPLFFDHYINTDQTIADLMKTLKEANLLQQGDLIVHISNMPINRPGKSNMIKLAQVE